MKQVKNKITRRQFLDHTAKGTFGLFVYPKLTGIEKTQLITAANKSQVIIVRDDDSATMNYPKVDRDVAQYMVDAGIRILTGFNVLGEAWKSLFPGITKNSIISIKVNCINSSLPSHIEVCYSIVQGLTKMIVDGSPFPENNIIIWDRTTGELKRAGYTINKSNTGIRCFGTNEIDVGYSTSKYKVAGVQQRLSKIITNMSDYMINLSVLKNHSGAGVTLSMKNHYGSCNGPGSLHDGNCNPYIPALNALQPIRDKQVINICDALYGVITGGPGGVPQIVPKSLIFSFDPVALDYIGSKMLEDNGCRTLKRAQHIAKATQEPYNLGTNDPAKIDITDIENPSTQIIENPPAEKSSVVIIEDDRAAGITNETGSIRNDIVEVMIDAGICGLADLEDRGEAWKSLFPNITQESVIGIKVNCENSQLSVHPEMTNGIIQGLTSMEVEGSLFPAEHIIIWDNEEDDLLSAGYTISKGGSGVQCYGTDHSGVGYSETQYDVNSSQQRLSKILTQEIDYLINVSVLRNHATAGVTLGLMNHLGSCDHPEELYDNHSDPYAAALNAIQVIRYKQVLSICDAIYGIVSGGPGGAPQIIPKKFIFSRDPVAMDYAGAEMLKVLGCKTTSDALYIETSAHIPHSLGTNDPVWIETTTIQNPSRGIIEDPPETKSPVCLVTDERAIAIKDEAESIREDIVEVMIDSGICSLEGLEDREEAWKNLFSGITQESLIGIKINCENSLLSVHPEIINGIIQGLTSMIVEGSTFPAEHIIIWDSKEDNLLSAGYTINKGGSGVKCYGTDHAGVGYSETQYDVNDSQQRLSKILTEEVDYLINVSVLRNHSTTGVTLGLMNHFGSCDHPEELSANHGDPYIAALNAVPVVQSKQVLSICDGIYGIVSGGPGGAPQVSPKSLIFSRDPVAHDYTGSQLLQSNGCQTIDDAVYIASAAKYPYSIGTNDPEWIETTTIQNPSRGIIEDPPETMSPVCLVTDDRAIDIKDEAESIREDIIEVMLDAGICGLAGFKGRGEAWKSFFSGITQESVIGIKINCENNLLSVHPEIIDGIIQGLTSMVVEGSTFPAEHIIIWDSKEDNLLSARYTINKGGSGAQCYGTDHSGVGHSETQYDVNGSQQRLSKILTQEIDYLINVSVLRNHATTGVTLGLMNHSGSCDHPEELSANHGDPYIAALNAIPVVQSKQVLSICDGIYGIVSGGPGGVPQVSPKSLIFSRDPVAHDYTGLQLLKSNGCQTIDDAAHIASAAKYPYRIGTNDPEWIETMSIKNPSEGIIEDPDTGISEEISDNDSSGRFHLYQNYPNPFNSQTTISYHIPQQSKVRFDIYSIDGRLVISLINTVQISGRHNIIWNGMNSNGLSVPSGLYIARFRAGEYHQTLRIEVIR
jgi:uncharacterized protein (DUF362 family)